MRKLIFFFLIVTGCTQYVRPVAQKTELHEKITFLKDGETRRDEVIARLGNPNEIYEGGHIIIFRPCEDKKEGLIFSNIECGLSLVLVFTIEGVLEKHSLIRGR